MRREKNRAARRGEFIFEWRRRTELLHHLVFAEDVPVDLVRHGRIAGGQAALEVESSFGFGRFC